MLAIERKNEILARLRSEQRVLVSELAAHYSVTEETIRRDLDKLEREGFATKTYGGAIWGDSTRTDLSYTVRNKTNVEAKKRIAQLVANIVRDGDHLMLDDSSTSYYIAKELRDKKNITVITNSVEIVMELSDVKDWNILSTGGMLKYESLALVGAQAEQMIRNYHVDRAIFACKGFDMENGATDSSDFHSQVKRAMMASARQKILAVDSSKFNRTSFVRIADVQELDAIITEKDPGEDWRTLLEQKSVDCICG